MTTTIEQLRQFANKRPGLNFADYGDRRYYIQDYREILKDLHSFNELMGFALDRIDNLNEQLTAELETTGDRLSLVNGKLQYVTGQYFPTEYRNAACRVLVRLIWRSFMNEKHPDGTLVYKDGHQIRKAINRRLRLRNTKLFFS